MPEAEHSQQRPSLTQRLVIRLMRGRADEIERQSREWFVVCPNCGLERTYGDLGGARYKARSRAKRIRLRCPSCGTRGMHAVEHRPDSGSPHLWACRPGTQGSGSRPSAGHQQEGCHRANNGSFNRLSD